MPSPIATATAHLAPRRSSLPSRSGRAHPSRRLGAIALILLALWLLALLAGPALLSASGIGLNPHGHTQLYAHGHPFVDARTLWGVPNAMDVLSNAALVLAGLCGLLASRGKAMPRATAQALRVFFAGLLLAGFGSAWYHWAPDAAGLMLDRLGMALTFSGALALAVAERVGQRAGRATLRLVLISALLSAMLPYSHGNVLPWAVVQFGGMGVIVWAALQSPVRGAIGVRLGLLIGIYALAKALELNDDLIFQSSGERLSGHSLKHIVAGLAAWPLIAPLMRQNAQAASEQPCHRATH